jgi:hypothetical protein
MNSRIFILIIVSLLLIPIVEAEKCFYFPVQFNHFNGATTDEAIPINVTFSNLTAINGNAATVKWLDYTDNVSPRIAVCLDNDNPSLTSDSLSWLVNKGYSIVTERSLIHKAPYKHIEGLYYVQLVDITFLLQYQSDKASEVVTCPNIVLATGGYRVLWNWIDDNYIWGNVKELDEYDHQPYYFYSNATFGHQKSDAEFDCYINGATDATRFTATMEHDAQDGGDAMVINQP